MCTKLKLILQAIFPLRYNHPKGPKTQTSRDLKKWTKEASKLSDRMEDGSIPSVVTICRNLRMVFFL